MVIPMSFRVKEQWFIRIDDEDVPNLPGDVTYWQHLVVKALLRQATKEMPAKPALRSIASKTFMQTLRVAQDLAGPRASGVNADAVAEAWAAAYSLFPSVFLVEDSVWKAPVSARMFDRCTIEVTIAGRSRTVGFALTHAEDSWSEDDVEVGIWARIECPRSPSKFPSTTLRDAYLQPATALVDVPRGALVWCICAC